MVLRVLDWGTSTRIRVSHSTKSSRSNAHGHHRFSGSGSDRRSARQADPPGQAGWRNHRALFGKGVDSFDLGSLALAIVGAIIVLLVYGAIVGRKKA
jgi:hypothetical protein